ncbi:MAG: HAMP domain-containing histidine kinase [Acidobacteria bacterium]|nr:HAMP domain-containing histidine kinase [Acidobacteriota bacterium]
MASTPLDSAATIDHYSSRLAADHLVLAHRWLERLDALLTVERRDVFPTHQLLDHIPDLLIQIAEYLRAPEAQEIAANTAVMAKATELGLLRFDQRASVHQLLREYQMFGEILDDFFAREAAVLGHRGDPVATVHTISRATQAVRVLQQKTVDAFITRYVETIERQTAQLRSFSRLVSHEIRQPLGVLQVLTRVMTSRGADPETTPLIESLERNVLRLGEVAGKLERLARLTRRPESTPAEQEVDLAAVTIDVARQLSEMADARGVRFEVAESLPRITADAGRVELVLMNLLANAIKYSDPAKPDRVVSVQWDRAAAPVRILVRDNGLGIPYSKRQRIFDQFVRVHAHLDDELGTQGLGLGLSIVRESMEAMGGTVAVESEDGKGTTFVLDWPASPPHRS